MSDVRAAFLADAGWTNATESPVAGDLSTRKYTRLTRSGTTAILMECDPATDTSLPDFLKMTAWLRDLGLSAPEILASDAATGTALLEDFGDAKLTKLIADNPACQQPHYETILDTLIAIRGAPAPDLPAPTASDLCGATLLADSWYPNAKSGLLDAFRVGLEPILADLLKAPRTVSLRDFHADNIIWLSEGTPLKQPGLLDYQDAFLIHPAYDLMSLLTDARTDVSTALQVHLIDQYARKTGDDPASVAAAVATLGAQRNLRILGIFARAARRDGKNQHLPAMARVHRHFMSCCAHPSLAPFSRDLATALPAPTPALLESLAS